MFQQTELLPSELAPSTLDTLLPADGGGRRKGASLSWNPHKSAQDTLEILGSLELASIGHVLRMCQILSEAKSAWTGKNITTDTQQVKNGSVAKYKEVQVNDWMRFEKLLGETSPKIKKENVARMIDVWASFQAEDGAVRKVLAQTAYLPTNKTALYEISTLDLLDPIGRRVCEAIIKSIDKFGEIGVVEIRSLKRSDGVDDAETTATEQVKGTTLKMPKEEKDLKVLSKNWKEIVEHLDAVNELTKGVEDFTINYTSPTDALKELAKRAEEKEKSWARKTCTAYVKKNVIGSLEDVKVLRKDGSKKSGKVFNDRLDTFLELVEKHKMKKEVEKIIKDRKKRLENESERLMKANSSFLKMQQDSDLTLVKLKEAAKAETFKSAASRVAWNEEQDTKKSEWD